MVESEARRPKPVYEIEKRVTPSVVRFIIIVDGRDLGLAFCTLDEALTYITKGTDGR